MIKMLITWYSRSCQSPSLHTGSGNTACFLLSVLSRYMYILKMCLTLRVVSHPDTHLSDTRTCSVFHWLIVCLCQCVGGTSDSGILQPADSNNASSHLCRCVTRCHHPEEDEDPSPLLGWRLQLQQVVISFSSTHYNSWSLTADCSIQLWNQTTTNIWTSMHSSCMRLSRENKQQGPRGHPEAPSCCLIL